MKKNNLKIVKINKNKILFNYEKKVLIKDLLLDLKLGYYDFEKEKPQKVKFSLEIDYVDKKPSNDKDLKSIVNYSKIVRLIKKLVNPHLKIDNVKLLIKEGGKSGVWTNPDGLPKFLENIF